MPRDLRLAQVALDHLAFEMFESHLQSSSRVGELLIDERAIRWLGENVKGAIPLQDIDVVRMTLAGSEMFDMTLLVRADNRWNARMKERHPWRWRFGLLTRSKERTVNLGRLQGMHAVDAVRDFLQPIGCNVELTTNSQ